jgi:hypothetical protein
MVMPLCVFINSTMVSMMRHLAHGPGLPEEYQRQQKRQ